MDDLYVTFQIDKNQETNKKFFVYRNKKYPFIYDLLKRNSKFFYINRKVYKNIDEIPLLSKEEEKFITISDETIQTFISCCQDEQCKICVKNIIELQYLSKKYDIPQLISITSKYLDDHWRKNALNSLLFKLQLSSNLDNSEIEEWNENYFDTQTEEEFIESNLEEFIDQEELLSLPISTLNKIFMKSIKTVQTDKAIEFLFKCLDIYGRDASILFNCVDFERQKIRVVDKLVHEYKENLTSI